MNKLLTEKNMQGARYFTGLLLLWIVVGALVLILQNDKAVYIAINGQHTSFLDCVMPYITYLGTFPVIFVCLLLVFIFPAFRTWKVFILAVSCNLVPFLIVQALKNFINAPRPLNYFHNAPWINFVTGQPRNFNLSFPSGHTEGIFALCCFLSLLLPRRYAYWSIIFFIIALIVAYSRIYLSQHFFRDVYGGSIIGTLSVLIIFALIKRLYAVSSKQ